MEKKQEEAKGVIFQEYDAIVWNPDGLSKREKDTKKVIDSSFRKAFYVTNLGEFQYTIKTLQGLAVLIITRREFELPGTKEALAQYPQLLNIFFYCQHPESRYRVENPKILAFATNYRQLEACFKVLSVQLKHFNDFCQVTQPVTFYTLDHAKLLQEALTLAVGETKYAILTPPNIRDDDKKLLKDVHLDALYAAVYRHDRYKTCQVLCDMLESIKKDKGEASIQTLLANEHFFLWLNDYLRLAHPVGLRLLRELLFHLRCCLMSKAYDFDLHPGKPTLFGVFFIAEAEVGKVGSWGGTRGLLSGFTKGWLTKEKRDKYLHDLPRSFGVKPVPVDIQIVDQQPEFQEYLHSLHLSEDSGFLCPANIHSDYLTFPPFYPFKISNAASAGGVMALTLQLPTKVSLQILKVSGKATTMPSIASPWFRLGYSDVVISQGRREDVASVKMALETAPALRRFSYDDPNEKDGRTCVTFLQERPNLQTTLLHLSLRRCLLYKDNASYDIIGTFTQLRSLDLADNGFSKDGMEKLWAACIPKLKDLQELDLSINNLEANGAIFLAQAIQSLDKLKILQVGGNKLKTEGITNLLKQLNKHIVELDISNNLLGLAGIVALGSVIANAPQLECLNLSENGIRSDGAKSLPRILDPLTRLTALNLSNNELGVKGIKELAGAVSKLTKLNLLRLKKIGCNDDGAAALAPALRSLEELKELDLESNEIENEGLITIVVATSPLTKLTTLNFKQTKVSKNIAESYIIQDILQSYSSVRTILLSCPDIPAECEGCLCHMLVNEK